MKKVYQTKAPTLMGARVIDCSAVPDEVENDFGPRGRVSERPLDFGAEIFVEGLEHLFSIPFAKLDLGFGFGREIFAREAVVAFFYCGEKTALGINDPQKIFGHGVGGFS
jgi:hypothetical protein